MRCPKCHYISFGSGDRCRNCGYEFSLAPDAGPIDLPIQDGDDPIGPMGDLQLRDRPSSSAVREPASEARRIAGASRLDLPLFSDRPPADDAPLITSPSPPRPPLSVRRAQPALPKPRPELMLPEIEDDEAESSTDAAGAYGIQGDISAAAQREQLLRRRPDAAGGASAVRRPPVEEAEPVVAPVFARLCAGVIDITILLGIDAAILYFTLGVLELPVAEVWSLPPVPLAVFLLLLNGGYLAIFTAAGGQTIGKMIAGIRVVAERPDDDQGFDRYTPRVSMGAAVLRAAAYLVSLMPAGLGFAAIVFDAEGRALHDRLAETRVIKA
jgi:uncharacterized RDD family membrane protein YckC